MLAALGQSPSFPHAQGPRRSNQLVPSRRRGALCLVRFRPTGDPRPACSFGVRLLRSGLVATGPRRSVQPTVAGQLRRRVGEPRFTSHSRACASSPDGRLTGTSSPPCVVCAPDPAQQTQQLRARGLMVRTRRHAAERRPDAGAVALASHRCCSPADSEASGVCLPARIARRVGRQPPLATQLGFGSAVAAGTVGSSSTVDCRVVLACAHPAVGRDMHRSGPLEHGINVPAHSCGGHTCCTVLPPRCPRGRAALKAVGLLPQGKIKESDPGCGGVAHLFHDVGVRTRCPCVPNPVNTKNPWR